MTFLFSASLLSCSLSHWKASPPASSVFQVNNLGDIFGSLSPYILLVQVLLKLPPKDHSHLSIWPHSHCHFPFRTTVFPLPNTEPATLSLSPMCPLQFKSHHFSPLCKILSWTITDLNHYTAHQALDFFSNLNHLHLYTSELCVLSSFSLRNICLCWLCHFENSLSPPLQTNIRAPLESFFCNNLSVIGCTLKKGTDAHPKCSTGRSASCYDNMSYIPSNFLSPQSHLLQLWFTFFTIIRTIVIALGAPAQFRIISPSHHL